MYLLLALLGVAAGGQMLAFALIHDHNPHAIHGTAFGLNNLAILIGGALFQPLISILLNERWGGQFHQSLPIYNVLVYQHALIVLVPCYGIALFVSALLLHEDRHPPVSGVYTG
jgi:MFS family permease